MSKVVALSDSLSPGLRAWQALRDAARALEAAANAVLGGGPSTSAPTWLDESYSVVRTVNEFLLAKACAGKSDRYLRQLRVTLSHFAGGQATLPISAVTGSYLLNETIEPKPKIRK
jgi:hypothetical protein